MTSVIRLSSRARRDLKDIWRYIARDSLRTADRITDDIERRLALLSDHPKLGRARPDIAEDARGLIVERWIVLYRIQKNDIQIVRVIDGARDLGNIDWPAD